MLCTNDISLDKIDKTLNAIRLRLAQNECKNREVKAGKVYCLVQVDFLREKVHLVIFEDSISELSQSCSESNLEGYQKENIIGLLKCFTPMNISQTSAHFTNPKVSRFLIIIWIAHVAGKYSRLHYAVNLYTPG